MLRLHLNCSQGGHTPFGRCICNTYANICTSVGIVASMSKTYYQKNTTHTSSWKILGFWNAQVTFKLQPRWLHPLWQVHLQYCCTSLHLCEHSGHHYQNMLSIKYNPNLNLYDSRVLECSGCITSCNQAFTAYTVLANQVQVDNSAQYTAYNLLQIIVLNYEHNNVFSPYN